METTIVKVNERQYKITAKTSNGMGLISRTVGFNHFTKERLLEIANECPQDFDVTLENQED